MSRRLLEPRPTPLLVPGELRVIDSLAATKFRAATLHAAAELGFDKVTAGVTLLDFAVRLLAGNDPKMRVELVREAVERAVTEHYGTPS
jgi:hypothetical protein